MTHRPGSGRVRRLAVPILALTVACGPAGEQNSAPPPTPPPTATTKAAPPAVTLVPHEKLGTLVPALSGWTREPIQTATVDFPAPSAHATAVYTRGQARIELAITDTGGHPDYVGSLAKIAGTTFTQQASNGYLRGTTIGGHPATESWNHVDRLGDISVLISRRVIVHATGTALPGIQTLRDLVTKVDTAGLK